jgi:23S rRNA (uracil1939-C5)-methyltransferase
MQTGTEVQLDIDRLGIYGEGVGRLEGFTLFVEGALPGERVEAALYEKRRTFARARLTHLHTPSAHRVAPPCPLFGECGGCQLMHLAYPQQLEAKRQLVVDALQRIGHIVVDVPPCIPSPDTLGYRNKIQLPVTPGGRLGLYAKESHHIVEMEQCLIHSPLGEQVRAGVQELLLLTKVALRHVLIRTTRRPQEALVVLVAAGGPPPHALAAQICQALPCVKGVIYTVNGSPHNRVLGGTFQTLAGRGWIEEELCGLTFTLSAASFFQVNPAQAEALYHYVLSQAALTGTERLLDAYSGVGTLALICARGVEEVVGIETIPEAVADAQENAQRNQIHNARFLCGPAEELIETVEGVDVALLNPPRKGCDTALLAALARKAPRRILYISCDMATLARDLALLCEQGYAVTSVQPFDMFPQTMHVECVAVLSRAVVEG